MTYHGAICRILLTRANGKGARDVPNCAVGTYLSAVLLADAPNVTMYCVGRPTIQIGGQPTRPTERQFTSSNRQVFAIKLGK